MQGAFRPGMRMMGGRKRESGGKAVDEIWVTLRRVRFENSVKFSAPAGWMPRYSWQPSLSWSLLFDSQFFPFLSFPSVFTFAKMSVRPVGNPLKRDGGNCFTRGGGVLRRALHKLSKVKGYDVWRDRLEIFLVLRYNAVCIKVMWIFVTSLCYLLIVWEKENTSKILCCIAN